MNMKKIIENGEYTDEVGMAKTNMVTIMRSCVELIKLLKQNEDLPEWVQDKIAMAKQNMVTVSEYMASNHQMGQVYVQPTLAEDDMVEDTLVKRIKQDLDLYKRGGKLTDRGLSKDKKPSDRSIQHRERK